MPCELMNARYSICATFFQAGLSKSQSFTHRSNSFSCFENCHQRSASDGVEPGKAFSELSSGSESRRVELFEWFTDFVKTAPQSLCFG